MIVKRAMEFIGSHTLPQVWNMAKYKVWGKRKGVILRYDPIRLLLPITFRCNMKCGFCLLHLRDDPAFSDTIFRETDFRDMSFDDFKWIVKKFKHAPFLTISGGEPFFNDNIFDMIEYGHHRKMHISVFTNGTLLRKRMDEITHSHINYLAMSLDAYDSKGYKEMRGGSKKVFDRIIEDIAELVERRNKLKKEFKLLLCYICTKANYRGIPSMIRLAESVGVDKLVFRNLCPSGMPDFTEDQCLYYDDPNVRGFIRGVDLPESRLMVKLPELYRRVVVERRCELPFTTITIYGNGDVTPCCHVYPRREYGNVFRDENVWNNEAFQKMRRILIDRSLPLPDLCKTCHEMGTPTDNSGYAS